MTAEELTKQLKTKTPPLVVDVRSGFEFRSGHIPGALNLPIFAILLSRKKLPRERQRLLVLTCEHGPRAVLAKGVLSLFGYKNSTLLDGHMLAYRKKRRPLEK